VIQYQGRSRIETVKEYLSVSGYASGFKSSLEYINGLLPSNEVVNQALIGLKSLTLDVLSSNLFGS
jgi:hypothetical protein